MTPREEQVEKILTYLTFTEEWVMEGHTGQGDEIPEAQLKYIALPLNFFNGATIGPDLMDTSGFGSQGIYFNPWHEDNLELQTMNLGEWSHTFINMPDEAAPRLEKATCLYHLGKYRKMRVQEVRGLFKLRTGDLVEWSHAWVYNNGTYQTSRAIYERRGAEWWCIGQPYEVAHPDTSEAITRAIFMAKSEAFTNYYDWRVELGYERPGLTTLPTISVLTDPEGARQAYRLRDIPAGKSRRSALRHWVGTYLRRQQDETTARETTVWAHLRGVEEFRHNGLMCRIYPSNYDLKKAAEFQRLRQEDKKNARRKVS
jgi:hypothetical protein